MRRRQPKGRWWDARGVLVASGLGLALALQGCGGAAPAQSPAASPDPPLDDTGGAPAAGAVAQASSAKVQQGIDAIRGEDYAGAKAILTQARSEAPKDAQAAYYLGVAQEQLGDIPAAEQEYRAALELDPKLVEASANLSAVLLDGGKASEALEVADKGLRVDPKHVALLVNRALALESTGNKAEALVAYERAVAARGDDPELRLAYADLLMGAGKKEAALAQVKAASDTDDPRLLAAVAHRLGKLGAPAECVATLDRALKSQPNPELFVRRGICRHDAGDDPGAQADYEAALKADPNSVPAHYYLGRHLAQKKDKKGAQAHLKKAVELSKGEGLGKAAQQALRDLK
ncbi:MAG TPA: tetratricopeptide repeat protein [Polyangiaceae bacterium]